MTRTPDDSRPADPVKVELAAATWKTLRALAAADGRDLATFTVALVTKAVAREQARRRPDQPQVRRP